MAVNFDEEQRTRANDLYEQAQYLHTSPDGNHQRSLAKTCVLRSKAQSALEQVNRSDFEKALSAGPGHLGEYLASPGTFDETEKVRKIQKLVNATCDK